MGERAHLARPEVDLDTHIADVVNVLRYEDLRDVVVVGHSYAGMVIRGVADREPERLATLVYLDAFVPKDGDRVEDFLPAGVSPDFEAMAAGFNGWQIPTLDPGDEDPAIVAWEAGRTVPHPISTFRQPIRLSNPAAQRVPRVFIHCTEKPGGDVFARFAARAREDAGWRYQAIDAVHDVMAVKPEELTGVLLRLV